jgi:hypothetical protein
MHERCHPVSHPSQSIITFFRSLAEGDGAFFFVSNLKKPECVGVWIHSDCTVGRACLEGKCQTAQRTGLVATAAWFTTLLPCAHLTEFFSVPHMCILPLSKLANVRALALFVHSTFRAVARNVFTLDCPFSVFWVVFLNAKRTNMCMWLSNERAGGARALTYVSEGKLVTAARNRSTLPLERSHIIVQPLLLVTAV